MGYGLNAFLDADDPVDILVKLMVGSEGTLGFVASAVLTDRPGAAARRHRPPGLRRRRHRVRAGARRPRHRCRDRRAAGRRSRFGSPALDPACPEVIRQLDVAGPRRHCSSSSRRARRTSSTRSAAGALAGRWPRLPLAAAVRAHQRRRASGPSSGAPARASTPRSPAPGRPAPARCSRTSPSRSSSSVSSARA